MMRIFKEQFKLLDCIRALNGKSRHGHVNWCWGSCLEICTVFDSERPQVPRLVDGALRDSSSLFKNIYCRILDADLRRQCSDDVTTTRLVT